MSIPASVLVAEGSRDCADAVAMLLAENGMKPSVAYDGAAALLLGAREKFEAAVMDISIPGASGLEVAQTLRKLRGDAIRLVAYTAWPDSVAHQPGVEAAFDEVVSKSSDPLDLLRAVSSECYGALLRSMQAGVAHLRIELKLAHSLLDTASMARPAEKRDALRPLVDKRLRVIERAASRVLMSEARDAIEVELGILRSRLAKLR